MTPPQSGIPVSGMVATLVLPLFCGGGPFTRPRDELLHLLLREHLEGAPILQDNELPEVVHGLIGGASSHADWPTRFTHASQRFRQWISQKPQSRKREMTQSASRGGGRSSAKSRLVGQGLPHALTWIDLPSG